MRRAPTTPAERMALGRCELCQSFMEIGFCHRYQTPVEREHLCDSFVSVHTVGKRQWAEP